MKNSFLSFVGIATLSMFLSLPLSAASGGADGGGGDKFAPDHGAAWFVGKNPVHFCITSSPSFGISDETAKNITLDAAKTWRDYMVTKQLESPVDMNLVAMSSCDGTEDITFYLGTTNPHLTQEKKVYDNPSAFVLRTAYDPNRGWGKGMVWITPSNSFDGNNGTKFPNWNAPSTFKGIVLHELGHIFGNSHVYGTIMDKDISAYIQGATEGGQNYQKELGGIDISFELRICETCALDIKGRLAISNLFGGAPNDVEKANFRHFVGRDAIGNISAEILRRAGSQDDPNRPYTLIIGDEVGSKTITLQVFPDADTMTTLDAPLFYPYLLHGSTGGAFYPYSTTIMGIIHGADGAAYPVMVSRNANMQLLTILYIDSDKSGTAELFSSNNDYMDPS